MLDRNRTKRSLRAVVALLALAATLPLAPTLAGAARLEGLVRGIDGRPAAGHRVHLIDAHGEAVATRVTTPEGLYAFDDLEAGRYGLGIENPAGQMAPVAAPPVRLAGRELARRDVKLMQGDQQAVAGVTAGNYGIGLWWASLSTTARVWTVVGIVTAAWITYEAISDDDDDPVASPF